MDMNMGDPSAANLPISDPRCLATAENCLAFYAAENRSQETVPWAGQFEYGHWVTYYYVIVVSILMLVHGVHLWHDNRSRADTIKSTTLYFHQKALAAGQYISYRCIALRPFVKLGLPSCGMLLFLLSTLLFLVTLTFAVRPYYQEHLGYGSPPIAIRSGLIAFACTPILVILAGKANLITLLSGIGYKKLNVVRRWVAWMSFALSIVHSVPFFVASYKDGGYARVKSELYVNGTKGANEYSGVPPFAILFGLCILSLPLIRNRFYENFYHAHILLAITYIGLLFWLAGNTLDSWAYLWATIALWLVSYLARAFWFTQPLNIHNQWLTSAPTSLLQLGGAMTQLEVTAPPRFSHRPAQHCYLRFPAISLLDNHPFTIASAPRPMSLTTDKALSAGNIADIDNPQTLLFLTRTHTGFTRKVAAYCASYPGTLASAWIDGPYGGIGRPVERLYDTLILVAGGTGITACLPWLTHMMNQNRADAGNCVRIRRIVLVWTMRDAEHFTWVAPALERATIVGNSKVEVQMKFYVTNSADSTPAAKFLDVSTAEKGLDTMESSMNGSSPLNQVASLGEYHRGRPIMMKVVGQLVGHGRTVVFGCGPESLRTDLTNAYANMQVLAIKGEVQEVAMHLEAFGW